MYKMILKPNLLGGLLLALLPGLSIADAACVVKGGLAWDNWTKEDSGGSGQLPAGEANVGYVQCKSCHGWDRLGMEGGYVRRSRTATRPNAGLGDGDSVSRNVSTGIFGKHTPITAEMILHGGIGRAISEGSGSWVAAVDKPNAQNRAEHQKGYTLGNQHPNYTGLLTNEQVACLAEFLNAPETQPDNVFKRIEPQAKPVAYEIIDTADELAGQQYYERECTECHGSPTDDQSTTSAGEPKGGFIAYLKQDGKFSEFAHKMYFGVPDEPMTRSRIGNPTQQDVANVLKYLQKFGQISSQDLCGQSKPKLMSNAEGQFLHLPRVDVGLGASSTDYWATLRFSPELSNANHFVFELTDVVTNAGGCQ